MKRRVLLLAVLVAAAAAPAHAQFGIRGGINLTRFVGGDAENVDSKQGLNFGGSLYLLRLGPVAIVPEIYYSQKGATMGQTAAGEAAVRYDFSLDYLEVPVLAKLSLPVPGLRGLRPYLAAGPAFAWKLDCEVVAVGAGGGAAGCGEQFGSAGTAFRSADRGLVVSGGIDLDVLRIGALTLDARLVRGLQRLTDGTGDQPELRNQAFSLMLGYSVGR